MSLSSKQWLGSILGLGSLLSLGSHVVLSYEALAHPIGIPSGQTLFSITEPAQASQPTLVAQAVTVDGVWNTSEGQMTFQQQGSSVTATYTQDNGRIEATMTGNVLEGFWSEDGSNRRCDTAINGRYHWGRIRFVFDGNSFQGTWSYCNDEPTLSWTGTRLSGGGGSAVTPIAPAPSAAIAGAWNTSEGIMPLTLNGSTVTGYYSNDTQRIDGTLVGNTLDGYWSKDTSARSCDTLYNGRDHWGRIRFVFEGNSFQGVWGYCGEEPTRSWTGSR